MLGWRTWEGVALYLAALLQLRLDRGAAALDHVVEHRAELWPLPVRRTRGVDLLSLARRHKTKNHSLTSSTIHTRPKIPVFSRCVCTPKGRYVCATTNALREICSLIDFSPRAGEHINSEMRKERKSSVVENRGHTKTRSRLTPGRGHVFRKSSLTDGQDVDGVSHSQLHIHA